MPVLSVCNLRKVYPGKKPFTAVDGVSFDLEEGEILGLLGPNGAGKTTTIQMLMGVLTLSSGSITYFGKDFFKHRSEVLRQVAFASTYVSLPWNLTVHQNLETFARLYGFNTKKARMEREELLERFGILKKLHTKVTSLSSGQITRLMLVKAFMVKPKIVLLDEPTASLDPDIANDVIEFILKQRNEQGTSFLFTSHKMAEVTQVCDRVLFLREGKIFADDIPKNLAKSVSPCKIELVMAEGMKETVAVAEDLKLKYKREHSLLKLELDEKQIAHFLSALAEAKVFYSSINIIQPTLEDYFFQMAKETAHALAGKEHR